MTLQQFCALLLTADPAATRYEADNRLDGDYTIWRETRRIGPSADGRWAGGWRVYVDRFTRTENDSTAAAILQALESSDEIAVEYLVDPVEDGYIHHIYECDVA